MKKCLVIGCGTKRDDSLGTMVYLDIDPACNPDVVWDLTQHPLPFQDEEFDSIFAVHVLEHLADQGDFKFFFKEFEEYWRVLKPDGRFTASCPLIGTKWAWGDPGHRRVIQKETLFFLDHNNYGNGTTMCDYRPYFKKGNFAVSGISNKDDNFMFTLVKKEISNGKVLKMRT